MASAQSSQDMQRGRDRQLPTLRSPRPRHRSKCSRLYGNQRLVAHKRDHCPGALHEGDVVRVFSRSADVWVDGEAVQLMESNFVWVEYEIGENRFGKSLHLHSEHLEISSTIMLASDEVDPGAPILQSQPMMQGCRATLPTSPNEYYITPKYMLQMARDGDVALIKGSWLLKCYEQGSILPRRQDLPPEAMWDIRELEAACGRPGNWYEKLCPCGLPHAFTCRCTTRSIKIVDFVSVSHCWYTKEHPDPDGLQVQDIGVALSTKLKHGPGNSIGHSLRKIDYDLAIFWCWCSFFQEPRTPPEQTAFERSMQHMDLWYTNSCVDVWMLTKVPENVENRNPFDKRGWTTWEKSVARLLPHSSWFAKEKLVLDIDALEADDNRWHRSDLWERMISKAIVRCGLPLEPDAFTAVIHDKHFTKGATDLEMVNSNYRRNFRDVMSVVTEMEFQGSRATSSFCTPSTFGDEEMAQLCQLLPFLSKLGHLKFRYCNFGDLCADVFAASLTHCKHLQSLYIDTKLPIDKFCERLAIDMNLITTACPELGHISIAKLRLNKQLSQACNQFGITVDRGIHDERIFG